MSARPITPPEPERQSDGRALLARIRHMGRTLDDLESLRVRHDNRRGAFEREHEIMLPLDEVADALAAAENAARLELLRLWRQHPLAAWAKETRGVGEKSIARLIAEIGDPADRPNVAKLWAYCGVGNPARIRVPANATQADVFARGNRRARKQLWLIATRMLMSGNRGYYDARRADTAEREDWTDGHKHNDALRVTAKYFLRDLWVAAGEARS